MLSTDQISDLFLTALCSQLLGILGIRRGVPIDRTELRLLFRRLWRTVISQVRPEKPLLLLVNGLDKLAEDDDLPIVDLLPDRLGNYVHVIVLSRSNPDPLLPIASDHPFKLPEILELRAFDEDEAFFWDILGILAVSLGGLRIEDLGDLLSVPRPSRRRVRQALLPLQHLLSLPLNRLDGVQEGVDLIHSEVRAVIRNEFTPNDLKAYESVLIEWCRSYIHQEEVPLIELARPISARQLIRARVECYICPHNTGRKPIAINAAFICSLVKKNRRWSH